MPAETHLVLDLGMLKVRPQGPAIAGMWFLTGHAEFPMAGWSDFVVVVLGWWLAAILRLMHNESRSERVNFMDGPYAIEVCKAQHGKLRLTMFAGPSGGREVAVGEADGKHFMSDLVTQARKVLNECKLRDWWSSDAEALESHLETLEYEIACGTEAS